MSHLKTGHQPLYIYAANNSKTVRTCVCLGSSLEDSVVRWCCISHAEQEKCEQWALSIKSDPLVCVSASSMTDCIEKIKVQ